MSFGIVEIITLLLGLSGFSLQHNPKPATPDQALAYAMPDADVVVHVDASAVIGNNYKLLTGLQNQPQIKASPELSVLVRKAVGEIDGLKGLIKSATGVDLTTDVSDATLFVQVPPAGAARPELLVSVRGKFSVQTIDKIAKLVGPATRVGGGAMIELPMPDAPFGAIAVTRNGTFLAGSSRSLRERLATTWRMPARPANSNLAHVATVLEAKPVFAVALTLSPGARKQIISNLHEKNFVSDVVTRHKLAAFSVFHDGIGWTWVDRTRGGLDQLAQISEGMMDVLRAAQIAPRGFAKILMAALDSYKGTNKRVDELIRHKADLWKIVESYTGDGNFKVAIDKNPAALRLTARATGKSLSEVVPAGLLIPAGMVAFLTLSRDAGQSQPVMVQPTPSRPAPPRLSPKRPPPPRPSPRP